MKWLIVFGSLMVVQSACYYDNEVDLYGVDPCEVPTVSSYQTDVAPIIEQYCGSCHSGASASDGIAMDNYTNLLTYVENGSLVASISHLTGYSPMPKGEAKLSDCKIQTIKQWVDAGAPNN